MAALRRLTLFAICFASLFALSTQQLATNFTGLHAVENQLQNANGEIVRLRGVDHSGTEWYCVDNGNRFFDGPHDLAMMQVVKDFGANVVRIPLNEDCWLGLNGYPLGTTGAAYQRAIVNYVNDWISLGFAVVLDLHWTEGANGSGATGQQAMPDLEHAPAFWSSVANIFKSKTEVIFDLFNEPWPWSSSINATVAWNCWLTGENCSTEFPAAGMQTLLNAVRDAGAPNFVVLGGLDWSNSLDSWLEYMPQDPLNNIGASMHIYDGTWCSNVDCFDKTVLPVLNQVPLIVTEFGTGDCDGEFVQSVMYWLDQHCASYIAWTWNTWDCSTGPALISDYSGALTGFGKGVGVYWDNYPLNASSCGSFGESVLSSSALTTQPVTALSSATTSGFTSGYGHSYTGSGRGLATGWEPSSGSQSVSDPTTEANPAQIVA